MASMTVVVGSQVGLHARPASIIAEAAGEYDEEIFLFLEGEEEIGSPSLDKFLRDNKELLKADVILVSDTSMISKATPSLTTGLRGLAYWQIKVTGPNRDLHSGHFGGAVANPINELCKIIARMVDENGRITIPGFYDDVVDMTPEEHENYARIPFDEEEYKKAIDISDVKGEVHYSTLERNSCRPSFDVCGTTATGRASASFYYWGRFHW